MTKSFSTFWLFAWSLLLALGWLLPNHYRPWTSFHSEVWVAIVLAAVVPWAILRAPSRISLLGFECVVTVVAIIPAIQFVFGQLPYFGQAWVASIYLLGFLLAILTGHLLEVSNPGRLVDMLVLAVGLAAFASVLFQMYQWLGLDGLGIWLVDKEPGKPPAANLGQRNQLATLLIWGMLAIFWGRVRSYLGSVTTVTGALLILFGIALTGSRTAWVGLCLLVVACWYWRHLWHSKLVPWVAVGLTLYFVACVLVLKLIPIGSTNVVATSDFAQMEVVRVMTDERLAAWKMFVGAALERPIFGYGWGQIAEAHISVATQYPALNIVFSQSHNLFLDLVLWCGIPIGLFCTVYLLRWFLSLLWKVDSQESAVIFLFILVVANHSMFEFPLYYAYFLLPLGLLIGVLSARDHESNVRPMLGKHLLTAIWLFVVSMLGVTIVDYFKIEHSYQLLRMEWLGFNLEASPQPPKVTALNQWHHIIKQARVVPFTGMAESELQQLRVVAMQAHKPIDFRNLAIALELNGKSDEAELWIERLCRVGTEENCLKSKEALADRRNQ